MPVTAAVPLSTPLGLSVTPLGSEPLSVKVGAGKPVAVTVNELAAFTTNVAPFALVMAGAWFTVSMKFWVAFDETPFEAVMVMGYVPPVPAPGVPLSMPAEFKVTPLGSVPVSLKVIVVGKPEAVTVNEPAVPVVKVVLAPLVIAGAWSIVNVKVCVAFGVTPFAAVKVME